MATIQERASRVASNQYAITYIPNPADSLQVYINGVYQAPSDWVNFENLIIFQSVIPSDYEVFVIYEGSTLGTPLSDYTLWNSTTSDNILEDVYAAQIIVEGDNFTVLTSGTLQETLEDIDDYLSGTNVFTSDIDMQCNNIVNLESITPCTSTLTIYGAISTEDLYATNFHVVCTVSTNVLLSSYETVPDDLTVNGTISSSDGTSEEWGQTTTIVRENSSKWFYTTGGFTQELVFDSNKVLALSTINQSVTCTLASTGNVLGTNVIMPISGTGSFTFDSSFIKLNGSYVPYTTNYFIFTYVGNDNVIYTISPVF